MSATTGPPAVTTCYRHADRPTGIRCTRCERPICPDCMHDAAVGFQCPECVRGGQATQRQSVGPFGARAGGGTPVMTYALIGLNVAFFLATLATGAGLGFGGRTGPLFDRLALASGPVGTYDSAGDLQSVSEGVAGGAYYRLLTACFLHFGVLHLAVNMYSLLLLGSSLEPLFGRWRFLSVYLLAGLGGSTLTYLLSDRGLTAGASGAIFGLFSAFFLAARRAGVDTGAILTTVGINLLITFAVPQISKTGHVGGLLVGAAAAAVVIYAPRVARRTALQVGGLVAVGAVLAVLLIVRTTVLTA